MIFASSLFTLIFGTLFTLMTIAIFIKGGNTNEYTTAWWTFLIIFAISGGVLTELTNFFNCDCNKTQIAKEHK